MLKRSNDQPPLSAGNNPLERYWYVFIVLALLFRALYIFYQIDEMRKPTDLGVFSITVGDTNDYVDPIENLIAHGSYDPDYRMPGVGAPYYLFRQFFNVGQAYDAMVILQWLFSGLSVYLLALIALRLTGSTKTALVVYTLFLISAYTSWYDASIASDSLSVTVMIFQIYVMQKAIDKQHRGLLALAGLLLAWCIFMRPVVAALLVPAAYIVYSQWNANRSWRAAVIFLVPFLLFDGVWIIRNWNVNHQFRPLTNQGLMPDYLTSELRFEVMSFIQCYGGNYIWWAPGADMRWYGIWKGGGALDNEGRDADPPPNYAYVPGYDQDSLSAVAADIRSVMSGTLTTSDSVALTASLTEKLRRYSSLYREQAPFNYHVLSRIRMLYHEMKQNGTETLLFRPFGELPMWEKFFKLTQAFLFRFSFTVGVIALFWLPFDRSRLFTSLHVWIPLFTAFTILIYPVGLRMCEWRYLVMIYPLALLMAVDLTMVILRRSGALGSLFKEQ